MPGSPSPWTLGGLTPHALAMEVWRRIFADEILDRAAALSYYFLFALFPTLLFLVSLFGMLPVENLMGRFLAYAHDMLPPDVASLLERTLDEVVEGANRGLLSVGALATLWAASRGIRSVIGALNIVYDVTTPRVWWRRQLVALALTVALCVFALTGLALLAFGEWIGGALAAWIGLGAVFELVWRFVQWPLAALFAIVAMDVTYALAPARERQWTLFSPGAVFAFTTWVLVSLGLRIYVDHFGTYNATYGSIGAVILLMLWLYLTGLAFLVGGEINAVIATARAPAPAVGPAAYET